VRPRPAPALLQFGVDTGEPFMTARLIAEAAVGLLTSSSARIPMAIFGIFIGTVVNVSHSQATSRTQIFQVAPAPMSFKADLKFYNIK
jgi:hypothetical protein